MLDVEREAGLQAGAGIERILLGSVVAALLWSVAVGIGILTATNKAKEKAVEIAFGQAKALLGQLVDTRSWNSMHSGVDVTTTDGTLLTQVNPGDMTGRIAEITQTRNGSVIHLTSIDPIRPDNAHTVWEREALAAFAAGASDWHEFSEVDGASIFRYMEPLITEPSCLSCHEVHGYQIGDLRGGLSIALPVEPLVATSLEFRTKITVTLAMAWLLGLGFIAAILLVTRQNKRWVQELEQLATIDQLTGLKNRRALFFQADQLLSLAARLEQTGTLFFLDLDNLKKINDSEGHAEGDRALVHVANALRAAFRDVDLVARFGGDEFVVVAIGHPEEAAAATVERFRALLARETARTENANDLSVAIGIARIDLESSMPLADALAAADHAMYMAKRDRVASGGSTESPNSGDSTDSAADLGSA